MRNKVLQIKRALNTALLVLLMIAGMTKVMAQQPQIKVSEINVSNIGTIEERVFMVHSILERGYYCYKNFIQPNIIDIYVSSDALDEMSDFDFFFDNILYDQLNEFAYLDKTMRGELFVEWRQEIDDDVYSVLYEDFTRGNRTENAICETALPFCTNYGSYQFPAGVNSGSPCGSTYNASCSDPYKCSGTPGQSTNCLSTAPNPAFYYMQIDEPGNLNIKMYTTPSVDIDFDCWGPFSNIETACSQLSCSNIVDCSYSTSQTEYCHINNAQHGQYYVLLITNYSNQPANISFENVGTGSTMNFQGETSIIIALANPVEGGTVSGGGEYEFGSTCTLTATANEGYYFKNWTENSIVVSNNAEYSFSVTHGRSIVANFELPRITVTANPEEGGTVSGDGTYLAGQTCTLTAIPNEDYTFVNWTENGEEVSTNVEYSFTVVSDRNLVANFRNIRHEIWVTIHPNEGGTVYTDSKTMDRSRWLHYDNGTCATNIGANGSIYWGSMFPADMLTENRLIKVALYENSYNTGSITLKVYSGGDTAPETLLYTQNITPVGADAFHEITLTDPLTIDPSQNIWIVFYQNGDSYPATACTDTGDANNRWVSLDGNSWMDLADAGLSGYGWMIRALFEVGEPDLMESYLEGETCTLTATPNESYAFNNWTENGEVVSYDAEYSFTVTGDRNLVANFSQYTNHWTAESFQNNMLLIGVVKIDGVEQVYPWFELGAFCNGECRGTEFPVYEDGRWLYYLTIGGNGGDDITFRIYDHALQRELNLYCFSDVQFEIYGLIGMDDPYEVLFARLYNISVVVYPENSGAVFGAGTYVNGTNVTLTASANENSSFINWTIGDEQVSTDTEYSFTVTEDLTIVANFLPRYEVTASVNPAEGGFVSGAGIYDYGTNCTLVAAPNASYAFCNWSINGEIVSTEPSYIFTVTAPVNLMANFGILCPVSAIVSPEDAGTITGVGEYVIGTDATLTAIANEGYAFNSWTLDGEVVSTEPSYTFTVTVPVSLTANFDILYSVSISVNMEDAGMVTGEGEYLLGTSVMVTATPNEGYAFNSWTLNGEVVSTEPSYTFTVTESVNLTANFDVIRTQQLVMGWNWWSTCLDITVGDLQNALVEALPDATNIRIKSQDGGQTVWNGRLWTGRLKTLDVALMYKISVPSGCDITLAGIPVNPEEHPVTIKNGANWIGFPIGQNMSTSNALVGFPAISGDQIKSTTNNTVYVRGAWRGALSTFEPGQGYIFLSVGMENRTLTFPSGAK